MVPGCSMDWIGQGPIYAAAVSTPSCRLRGIQSKSKATEKVKDEKAGVQGESSDSPTREAPKQSIQTPPQTNQKPRVRDTTPQSSGDCQRENTEGHCHHEEQKREETEAKRAVPEERHRSVYAQCEAIQ